MILIDAGRYRRALAPRPLVTLGTDKVGGGGNNEIPEAPYLEKRLTPATRQDLWRASDGSKGGEVDQAEWERSVMNEVGRILGLRLRLRTGCEEDVGLGAWGLGFGGYEDSEEY